MRLRNIILITAGRVDRTAIFSVTLVRSVSLTFTATEHVGMHLSVGLKCLWMELSLGFALWEKPFSGA
jgi:hypothetical protein